MYRNLIMLVAVAHIATGLEAAQFAPRVGYRSVEDSPFHDFGQRGTLLVEDFEDGLLDLPGVRQISGGGFAAGVNFVGRGFSVAADAGDGVLGRSLEARPSICAATFPRQCPANVRFGFSDDPFGTLPTFVGFVWTDAVRENESDIHPRGGLQVIDALGNVSHSVIDGLPLKASLEDSHADDIFIGFLNEVGISEMTFTVITDGGGEGHLAIDHLQIGIASLAGDANRNGAVEFNDFLTVRENFATPLPANWSVGDFNFDRRVSFPDFTMLSQNWGRELVAAERFSVPEPAVGSLLAGTLLGVLRLRHRRAGQRSRQRRG